MEQVVQVWCLHVGECFLQKFGALITNKLIISNYMSSILVQKSIHTCLFIYNVWQFDCQWWGNLMCYYISIESEKRNGILI